MEEVEAVGQGGQLVESANEFFENFDDDADDHNQPQYGENDEAIHNFDGMASDDEDGGAEIEGRALQNDTGGSRNGTEHESNEDDDSI